MPPDSGEKIALGVTVTFSTNIFLVLISVAGDPRLLSVHACHRGEDARDQRVNPTDRSEAAPEIEQTEN